MEQTRAQLDGELALAVVKAAADMVLVLDEAGRVRYANDEAGRVLGYTDAEFASLRLADIDPALAPAKRWARLWARISADSEVRVRETRHRCLDGRLLPVEVRARYVEVGGRAYVFSFARDISERLRGESDLRRSEALYRRLLDELPVSVVHNTPDGRILFLNEYGRRSVGYSQDELQDIRTADLYAAAADRERLVRGIESGDEYAFEIPMRHKDGRLVWMRGKSRVLHDVDGQVYYQGVAEDVTAERLQKAAAEALAELRRAVWGMQGEGDIGELVALVRLVLEKLDVPVQGCAIHVVDDPHRPTQVQTLRSEKSRIEWKSSLNSESEGLVLDLWRRGEPVYRSDLRAEDVAGGLGKIEQNYSHPVRSVVDVPYSHGTLAVNNEAPDAFTPENIEAVGRVAEVLSEGFRRLDDLRRLARRAREGESLARAIQLVAAGDRPEEIFAAVVSEAAQLTGCERSSLFIYDPDEGALVPQAQVGHSAEYMAIRLRKGEDMSGKVFESGAPMVLGPDTIRAIEESRSLDTDRLFRSLVPEVKGTGAAVPLVLEGVPIGTLAVGSGRRLFDERDVGLLQRLGEQAVLALDRARRTEDLKERNRQLEEQAAESRRLEAQLRQAQKMEAIGQLTAGVAHNFNNILQIIKANLYLASDESGAGAEPLNEADAAVERAAVMIRHLLVFSRRERLDTPKAVDLGRALGYVADICQKTFDRRIEIDFVRPPDRLAVRGDRGLIEQVFLNLCLNARDAFEEHGPGEPRLALSLSQRAGEARIVVEDNGCGMDRWTRERIFDPFFTTKEVGQGTGLGLSTVYGIVAQHGGSIVCESEPGQGTRFVVRLPLVAAGEEAEPAALKPEPKPAASRTVLLVDDEEQVRLSTARMLESGGYRVLTAADGQEGVDMFEAAGDTVDLVLLDLSMPRLSGRQALQALRRTRPAVKVLVCTGYGARQEGLGPVEGILTKPFMRDQLLRAVEEALGDSSGGEGGA